MDDELPFVLDDDVAAYLESLPALCEHDLLERADPSNDDDLQLLLAATADAVPDAPPDARTDALSGHQSGEQRATEPPPPPQRRPRAKRSRNLARERMQSELKQLRVECADLETQFAALKRQRTLSEGEQLLLASWHRVQDQRTKRLRAERENEQLKQAIAHQTALAASLTQSAQLLACGRTPNERSRTSDARELMRLSGRLPRRPCTDEQDAAAFASLVAEVDAAYAQTDSVFDDAGLRTWQRRAAHTPSRQSRAQLKTRRSETAGDGAFYIELLDARVHACATDALFRVLWDCWEQQYAPASCVVYDLEAFAADSVLAARVTCDVVVAGTRVSLEFLGAAKVYVSASGAITSVWRSVSAPNGHVPGVYVDETGWDELRPTSDGGSTVLSLTQIETKTARTAPTEQPSLAVPLAHTLACNYDAEMESVSSAMAGLLVRESAIASGAVV